MLILSALLGLNLVLSGSSVTTEARLSLLVVVVLAWLVPRSLPRTLSAEGELIRWKQTFQPPQTVARSKVSGIVYVPSGVSRSLRFYFVGQDEKALLWIDRFTPEQMGSFASYLGLTLRTINVAPEKDAAALRTVSANAITGSRRAAVAVTAACLVAGTGLTAVLASVILNYRGVIADYQRAPLCAAPTANPRACRFDTPAEVTGFTTTGAVELRFPGPVPTVAYRSTHQGLLTTPDPAFSVGDTVQVEVFDGWLMAINGARTSTNASLVQNSSWLLVLAAASLFIVAPGIGLTLAWRGPASWFVARSNR